MIARITFSLFYAALVTWVAMLMKNESGLGIAYFYFICFWIAFHEMLLGITRGSGFSFLTWGLDGYDGQHPLRHFVLGLVWLAWSIGMVVML